MPAGSAAYLQPLVDTGDVAALLRAVDGCCAAREWDTLAELAHRCREAIELGRQLWPVAMHIEYRLAYEAPGEHAARVVRPGAARFALGPLSEVAASTHTWDELAPGLDDPAGRATVAQERVLRGEDLRGRVPDPAELPLHLQQWEPPYALPTYRDREALFPAPAVVAATGGTPRTLAPAPRLAADPATEALQTAVEAWSTQSEGRVTAVAVEGDVAGAVAHLAAAAVITPVDGADALAWLQWAAASGGAHGRRRGGAAGRFAAWWALAALAGVAWPATPDDGFADALGDALTELRWYRWVPAEGADASVAGAPAAGAGVPDVVAGDGGAPQAAARDRWHLHLAVHDPLDGLAWAVRAWDRRADDVATPPA